MHKKEISLFFIYDPNGAKLLTCLRLQFSHLNKNKFGYGFGKIVHHMCALVTKTETTKVKPNFPTPIAKNQVLTFPFCMVLKSITRKVSIKTFLKM